MNKISAVEFFELIHFHCDGLIYLSRQGKYVCERESLALQRGVAEGCDDDHVLSAEEAKIKDGE